MPAGRFLPVPHARRSRQMSPTSRRRRTSPAAPSGSAMYVAARVRRPAASVASVPSPPRYHARDSRRGIGHESKLVDEPGERRPGRLTVGRALLEQHLDRRLGLERGERLVVRSSRRSGPAAARRRRCRRSRRRGPARRPVPRRATACACRRRGRGTRRSAGTRRAQRLGVQPVDERRVEVSVPVNSSSIVGKWPPVCSSCHAPARNTGTSIWSTNVVGCERVAERSGRRTGCPRSARGGRVLQPQLLVLGARRVAGVDPVRRPLLAVRR